MLSHTNRVSPDQLLPCFRQDTWCQLGPRQYTLLSPPGSRCDQFGHRDAQRYHGYNLKKKNKSNSLPEWATQITALREHLTINQAELARRMECFRHDNLRAGSEACSDPSAEHFIQLGNLGDKSEAWFFWEKAGIQPAKMVHALGGRSRKKRRMLLRLELSPIPPSCQSRSEVAASHRCSSLKGVVGAHGA